MRGEGLVCGLGEVGVGDRATVGGKAAGLGELIQAGIRVPTGFVVMVAAFERVLRGLDPRGTIRPEIENLPAADMAAIAHVSGDIRTRIAAAPLPDDLQDQIMERYRALGDGLECGGPRCGGSGSGGFGSGGSGSGGSGSGGPASGGAGEHGAGQPGSRQHGAGEHGPAVAVRSSATGEDAAEASFAGLQDTYLWVRGEQALIDHVRKCWASLYNAEAVGYRRRMKIGERGLAMAVVVQRMVEPRCAGVMFTCSPTTGDRSVVSVEACWGLGSALVSGDVTPDRFVISKVTGEILQRTVAAKLRLHHRDPGGRGVAAADVPGPLRDQPCLRDAEIAALARLGRQVEEHHGEPQDIEWAIPEGSRPEEIIVLLQSRPETVWARRRAGPVATPRARPADHVFEHLGRVNPVTPAPSARATPPAPAPGPER